MFKKNTKGQLSKTGIVLAVSIFYTGLILFLGFVDLDFTQDDVGDILIEDNQSISSGILSFTSNIGLFSFFGNVITGIGVLPLWLNTLIFTPLIIMIIWLIVGSLPTFNG